jgi:hypothetical protein
MAARTPVLTPLLRTGNSRKRAQRGGAATEETEILEQESAEVAEMKSNFRLSVAARGDQFVL